MTTGKTIALTIQIFVGNQTKIFRVSTNSIRLGPYKKEKEIWSQRHICVEGRQCEDTGRAPSMRQGMLRLPGEGRSTQGRPCPQSRLEEPTS